ncbi:MAG: DHA2 family efflux MFS transporter permease subunit [Thermomicrobiales bacterium]|nr:DHA2 family efflux MFS transporter permease subunit [Thermomicrobiales bacterium]
MSEQRQPVDQAAPERNPWLILFVLCGAVFMLLLDTTIVNVAQQKIKVALKTDLSEIQWILDSYILAYAVLILSFGRLGDVFGRKKLFVTGMSIFTLASALCAGSTLISQATGIPPATALIAARVLQGVGGAMMMPQTLSLITVAFPPQKRGSAMGVWGSVVALGAVLGPIVGGWLVTNYAWEWVFLINVPVGIAAILATLAIVPESIDPFASGRVDWGGILLSGLGTLALVYAAIEGNALGWTSPVILGCFAASIILLTLFVWWEARADDPMMKLELFAIRNFSVANILGLATSFGMLGVFFPMTVFLQGALGLSPLEAGLAMLPNGLVLMFVAPTAGRLSDKIGARWILVTGLSLMAVGIVAMIRQISPDATQWSFVLPLAITGVGMGMTFAPMTATAMRQVPPRIAGSASGILNTTRNLGQVLGIAVLGSILQSRLGVHAAETLSQISNLDPDVGSTLGDLIATGRVEAIPAALPAGSEALLPVLLASVRQAFALSMHETFAIGAITCLLGAGVALLIQNPKPGTVPSRQARAETVAHAIAAD